jgi:3-methyladenine DNA glycosylase AlkD
MPTVKPDRVIGIRTPVLRKFSNEFNKTDEAKAFLKNLPHKYYEENNLHAFLLEKITDYNTLIKELNIFLPFVDNWATCDMMKPKCFKKNKDHLIIDIKRWLKSEYIYEVRFGIVCLMTHFLDDEFKESYLDLIADIKSDEYYINMARAWFFATALTYQYEATIPLFENKTLDKWTHNKAIQKARESYRVTDEKKIFLHKLKV